MPKRRKFQTAQEYIAAAPKPVQPLLRQIRATVQAAVPDAEPCIGYHMPAFRLDRVFFYYAAFRSHIGIYPPVKGNARLRARLARYRGPKGNLSFPLAEPLPIALIRDVAVALAREHGRKPSR
ncbi:MAG: hypothetical protein J0M16_12095 [Gammaproteobacteria bacterium]|nr:hypothetical protein [Gammaproteobacteria bacterium]